MKIRDRVAGPRNRQSHRRMVRLRHGLNPARSDRMPLIRLARKEIKKKYSVRSVSSSKSNAESLEEVIRGS